MTKKKCRRIIDALDDDNFAIVAQRAVLYNIPPDVALNQIVSQWSEQNHYGRFETTEKPDTLTSIERKVIAANWKLNDLCEWVQEIKGYWEEQV